ncbi:unnamed protein product [Plutella xylostella]|uniref:(diamondback moth) hypothetical protein n=1 Tax=Plutella xylostella TaxID=51655 RepID=A0A8S4GDD6_PLUXY|nr:unnamed protein product [Plutella xylostella]
MLYAGQLPPVMISSVTPVSLDYDLHGNPSRILEDASLMCNSWSPRHNGDIFNINDGLLSRAEVLASVEASKHQSPQPGPALPQLKHDMVYHHPPPSHNARPHQMGHHGMEGLDMLEPSASITTLGGMGEVPPSHHQLHGYGSMNVMPHHHGGGLGHAPTHLPHPGAALHPDADTDPRELEAFAERFKQRRIKLGVTQADVGKALANLKLPGAKNKRRDPDAPSVLPAGEKKRKRTSIAAPEKRSLEAYFMVQPRPSGEKIAAIAEKLDLKKNVVRVWFCNQRQKQKRMKFAAQH